MNSSLENLFNMLGGLGLFLFGIKEMTASLEKFSASFIKNIIDKFTKNKYMAAFIGIIITVIVQSSSAVTVIVVGMVEAGMMALEQAAAVIMGANIGTTVTSLIIAINLLKLAPLFIFFGVIFVFLKRKGLKTLGSLLVGFGILFLGMNMMSGAVKPLSTLPFIKEFLISFNNPIIGVLFGITFTAIVQSSSVSIGMLEAMGLAGAISLKNAAFIIYGQNIGTCVTALFAAFGAGKIAKRTVVIHFLFNIIGAIFFVSLSLFTPFLELIGKFFSQNIMFQISFLHILFNVVSTIILLPIIDFLIKLSRKIVPDVKN